MCQHKRKQRCTRSSKIIWLNSPVADSGKEHCLSEVGVLQRPYIKTLLVVVAYHQADVRLAADVHRVWLQAL